jgi:hypothetical protein
MKLEIEIPSDDRRCNRLITFLSKNEIDWCVPSPSTDARKLLEAGKRIHELEQENKRLNELVENFTSDW